MIYEQVYDEDWLNVHKEHFIACCDCGLVHRFKYRYRKVIGSKTKILQVQVFRENRRTGQKRRAMGVKITRSKKK